MPGVLRFLIFLIPLSVAANPPQVIHVKTAVAQFLNTPFVQAIANLQNNVAAPALAADQLVFTPFFSAINSIRNHNNDDAGSPTVKKFLATPLVDTLLALHDSIPDDVKLPISVERFLQTPFVKAIDAIRKNVDSPQESVDKLLLTPFVLALNDLSQEEAGNEDVQKLLQTPLVKSIQLLKLTQQ